VTCEVCPHHLILNEGFLEEHGNRGKMNPPLRPEADRMALWEAIRAGAVDQVATDHAPHLSAEKDRPYWDAPAGVPGVETALGVMLAWRERERLSLTDLVRLMSTEPARRFRLARKGEIAPGADADLVLVDPARAPVPLAPSDLLTRAGWSPFEGLPLAPKPDSVWVGGRLVSERGRIVDDAVRGGEVELLPAG
jgi:dihydroorotase